MVYFLRTLIVSSLLAMSFIGSVQAAEPTKDVANVATSYKIGPGDVLRISVWKEEGMEQEVLVKPDGGITFPLAGEIQAKGLTTGELTAELKRKLKKYMPNPVVTVSVLQAVSNKIYVVGKVTRPGEYNATHYMDVLQALSVAGGLTPFAESDEIKIIRRSNGKKEIFEFDYDKVISGKKLDMNIILKMLHFGWDICNRI